VAQPPVGSSLLFGALADSGRIKERKNGSTRMVLKGVDDIDWFTDRPDRVAGEWSPKKLLKEWDVLFSDGAPNAQATFEMGSKRKLVTFEMFKPKLSDSNQTLSFKVRGIGENNKDLLTGLRNKRLSDASLFIDDGTTGDRVVNLKIVAQGPFSEEFNIQMDSGSPEAVFGKPIMISGYTDAELDEGSIYFVAGEEGKPGTLEVPVTLKNGLTNSGIIFYNQGFTDIDGTKCPYRSGPMVSYSVVGSSSGEVKVMCPEDSLPGMPGGGTSIDINWG
jgi:hypothetical protein